MSCTHYNLRHISQYLQDDFIRLDISIDKPVDDISDVSANLTRFINGVKSVNRIPYYGISFKDQRFFILLGTLSKDDEIDWKWARSFFRNYTARIPLSNNLKRGKLFFNHQKILPLFYKEYPNHHITFRINTISFTTRKIDISMLNLSSFNKTKKLKQPKKNYNTESFYDYLSKTNFNPYNLPCFAQGILGEGDDIKMKIAGVEYNSSRYSIEVRLYLTLIGFCLLLSFYAWKSLYIWTSTQAHVSSVSFLMLILICSYDISVCLDFSSTTSMNDCFMPPSRLYLFIFFSQMALYISMQFPIVYHVFKQQELIHQQNIMHSLFEIILFILICFLTHQLHIKSPTTSSNKSFNLHSKIKFSKFHLKNDAFSQKSIFTSFCQKINKKRLFSFIIACSQFTPQIFKNLKKSQRGGINIKFIILIGINRFLLFLYTDVYPFNIYETETVNKDFNDFSVNHFHSIQNYHFYNYFIKFENFSFPSIFILFQVFFLFCQQRFGPYFFIPKIFAPPTYNYREKKPRDNETCLVCQDSIRLDEEETAVAPCGHAFHLHCLARWMEEKQQCPICRRPIPPINFEDYPSFHNRTSGQIPPQNSNGTNQFNATFA